MGIEFGDLFPFSGVPGPFIGPWTREDQALTDIANIRELAERQEVRAESAPGPYELNVDTTALVEAQERSNEIAQESANRGRSLDMADQKSWRDFMGDEWIDYNQVETNDLLREKLVEEREANQLLKAISSDGVRHLQYACDAFDEMNATMQAMLERQQAMLERQQEMATRMERSAERRHCELLGVLKTTLANEAEEKYGQAFMQFRTQNYGLCLHDLSMVLDRNSTHVPALILFGRLCVICCQPALAKACYRRAADYAIRLKNEDGYVAAMIRLSHLERIVGNFDRAHAVMSEACKNVETSSALWPTISYEEIKSYWAVPENRNEEGSFTTALALRGLFDKLPGLRNEVAILPLFAECREYHPWLKVGDAPYADLNDCVELLMPMVKMHHLTLGDEASDVMLGYVHTYRELVNALLSVLVGAKDALERTDYGRNGYLLGTVILDQIKHLIVTMHMRIDEKEIGRGKGLGDLLLETDFNLGFIFANLQMTMYQDILACSDKPELILEEYRMAEQEIAKVSSGRGEGLTRVWKELEYSQLFARYRATQESIRECLEKWREEYMESLAKDRAAEKALQIARERPAKEREAKEREVLTMAREAKERKAKERKAKERSDNTKAVIALFEAILKK